MSKKEFNRCEIINRLIQGAINGTTAAELLHLSVRQVKRLKAKVQAQGIQGLVHGLRGKPSNRKIPPTEQDKIINLIRRNYDDFGPTLASEKLFERHGINRSVGAVRSLMIQKKLWNPQSLKNSQSHRAWRARKEYYGQMEQFDGSYEYWFEDRGPKCCLLAAIDDATGQITKAQFAPHEGVVPVFTFWKEYLKTQGKPRSVYLDKFSTYKMNSAFLRENHDLKTQFERAMQELNIEPISAHSPQAKGRIERLFGTLQDRLIKELRLQGISTIAEANRFLQEEFIPAFNARFAVKPALPANLHCLLSVKEQRALDAIFSRQATRTIQNDFTLSFNKQWYQLTKQQPVTVQKKDKVLIEERLDGSVWIRLRGKYLNYEILPERPKRSLKATPWVIGAGQSQPSSFRKPPADHPWRQQQHAQAQKRVLENAAQRLQSIGIPIAVVKS